MRFSAPAFLTGLLALTIGADARSSTGDRVLLVVDKEDAGQFKGEGSYTKFLESLESRGYQVKIKSAEAKDLVLEAFGEPQYDHMVMLASKLNKNNRLFTPQAILDAQSTYLNTLYVLSPDMDDLYRSTLREYDVEPSPVGSELLDAFSHVGGGSLSDVVLAPETVVAPKPVMPAAPGPIVFPHGSTVQLGSNPYLLPLVDAPATSYLGKKESGKQIASSGPHSPGAAVAAMQNRENVRIGFAGSKEMLSNEWWGKKLDGKETGNRQAVEDLTKWLFQETGVLKVVETRHHRKDGEVPEEEYRKKDEVTYSITLSEHATTPSGSSSWKPFNAEDLQLEFVMLDPSIRTALHRVSSDNHSSTYATTFTAPDRHGVFKFVVRYLRPGLSYIETADKTSVVPLRHDEHPRWITGAFPFYAGCVSTAGAFVLFAWLWTNTAEHDLRKKAE